MNKEINPLNDEYSFVRLVDYCGDDLSIVNAARVSFHGESDWIYENVFYQDGEDVNDREIKILSERDEGLINFLLKNKHGSPFEQGFMAQFHVRLPIFVMREWIRHRVGFSVNEESGRYVEMRPDFFIPDIIRVQKGKPGAYYFEEIKDENMLNMFTTDLAIHSHDGYNKYKYWLDQGIAKEQARLFLGLNLYTEIRWTCNARSLMNFLELRNAPNAMKEIQLYADAIEDIFAEKMPYTHKAFIQKRVAP